MPRRDPHALALFVRSVPGHVVPRYWGRGFIGVDRIPRTAKERVVGEPVYRWSDRIVAIRDRDYRRHMKALEQHIRKGALVRCTPEEWRAQQAALAAAPTTPPEDQPGDVDDQPEENSP